MKQIQEELGSNPLKEEIEKKGRALRLAELAQRLSIRRYKLG